MNLGKIAGDFCEIGKKLPEVYGDITHGRVPFRKIDQDEETIYEEFIYQTTTSRYRIDPQVRSIK